jgi:glycolate oxidase
VLEWAVAQAMADIVGPENLETDPAVLRRYTAPVSAVLEAVPDAVVHPASTAEVAEIVRGANALGIPVVPRETRGNLSAALMLQSGGIVVALDRMNRILELDVVDGLARIQPGVSAATLSEAVGTTLDGAVQSSCMRFHRSSCPPSAPRLPV